MKYYFGIDTSNYTTSVSVYNEDGVKQVKRLLPVKDGERGIRQSDAVFHHTNAYPDLLKELFDSLREPEIVAVGASVTPTTQVGSYMPCFLVGKGVGEAMSVAANVPFFSFSHQQGHIAAALYSTDKTELLNEEFLCFHVSGGTTDLVLCKPSKENIFETKLVSSSLDLKAGQAVDRIGVRMGISFPAGKGIEKLALGSEKTYKTKIKLFDGNCSLSGLENKCLKMLENSEPACDVAKFLLCYIADTLSAMTEYAFDEYGELPLVFAGGVMSNVIIKDIVTSRFDCNFAKPEFSCDNAAGIAYLTSLKMKK